MAPFSRDSDVVASDPRQDTGAGRGDRDRVRLDLARHHQQVVQRFGPESPLLSSGTVTVPAQGSTGGRNLRGETEAARAVIDQLSRSHGRSLLRFSYQLCHDLGQAQDLLQDAYVSVFQAWSRNDIPDDDLARIAYLRRTMVRRATHIDCSARLDVPLSEAANLQAESIYNDQRDELRKIWKIIETLQPRERSALVLRYYLDLSHEEVAKHLDCRVGTARSLCSRGLARVKAILDNQPDHSKRVSK